MKERIQLPVCGACARRCPITDGIFDMCPTRMDFVKAAREARIQAALEASRTRSVTQHIQA